MTGGSPGDLRIASYNIAHGRGLAASNWDGGSETERRNRLDEIGELLRDINADILVLNEVDFGCTWSYGVDQARYLAERLDYAYWIEERNLDARLLLWEWRFGNAILSRHPIVGARVVDLPGYSLWETIGAGKKRGVACDVKVGERLIRVIDVHLSHRSEQVRVESARLLTEVINAGKTPAIVAGDLNSTARGFPGYATDPHGDNAIAVLDAMRRLQRRPVDPPDHAELTFHSADPQYVIDWIMIPHDWRFQDYRVGLSVLSDHRPVFADVIIAPARTDPVRE